MSHRFMASTKFSFLLSSTTCSPFCRLDLFAFRLWRQSRFILPHNSTPLQLVLFKANRIQIFIHFFALWLPVYAITVNILRMLLLYLSSSLSKFTEKLNEEKVHVWCALYKIRVFFLLRSQFLSICFVISDWFSLPSNTNTLFKEKNRFVFFCWNRQSHTWGNTRTKKKKT